MITGIEPPDRYRSPAGITAEAVDTVVAGCSSSGQTHSRARKGSPGSRPEAGLDQVDYL